jgi:hypothetical protein
MTCAVVMTVNATMLQARATRPLMAVELEQATAHRRRYPMGNLKALFRHLGRASRRLALCGLLLAGLHTHPASAADPALNWASLSGEQQYILVGYAPRWAKLDLATRRSLLERADLHSLKARQAPAASKGATSSDKAADSASQPYKSSRRRRGLSAAEAALSAHSMRLRRVLRELPGLTIEERRALLGRWGGLSNSQRMLLVDSYMHNEDDNDALELQEALRDGTISHRELQRGLASGKLGGADVKEAIASGSLSTESIKQGVASRTIVAEHLEKAMLEGNIASSELSNAIEHHRTPPGATDGNAPP